MGFRRGAYICRCKDGFYIPNKNKTNFVAQNSLDDNYFRGIAIEEAFISTLVGPTTGVDTFDPQNFICIPCEPGCPTCADDSPCFVHFNIFIRAVTLGVQSFCATITFMIAIAICKLRRSKVWHPPIS
ncbi:unnamed protein product [Oppiella nova]|uniref:Uncharacterized protein n=1 Tax=Oppiella nova TaxID=334625 RepID=A0A7R9QF70_9ACAR|nr:unnamed protein product [Oppiella nova]CAG2164611.1 unnamed protein product [Oppiella nova]